MISTTNLQVSLRMQLNTILFAKTLVRKDVSSAPNGVHSNYSIPALEISPTPSAASSTSDLPSTAGDISSFAGSATEAESDTAPKVHEDALIQDEEDFSSKSQIMTLMTTDVDRVAEFSTHFSSLIGKSLLLLG